MKIGVLPMDNSLHIIRYSVENDIDLVREFIYDYWDEEHVFINNKELFIYQYLNNNKLNFVIAINNITSKIEGILGFIKYTVEYDNSDIFIAMWKVKEKNGDPFLGVRLLNFLKEEGKFRTISCSGINDKVIPIYKYFGYRVEKLKHYYILNDNIENYKIPVVIDIKNRNLSHNNKKYKIFEMHKIENLKAVFNIEKYKDRKPYKDEWYLNMRYFNYPFYKYKIFGIDKDDKVDSILIMREVWVEGSKVLRIVDFIGVESDLESIGEELLKIIYENNYEYIDMYSYGINDKVLKNTGFILRDEDDKNIIPNYFEPFIQENVNINVCTSQKGKFYIFKADGDQDRPNIIE